MNTNARPLVQVRRATVGYGRTPLVTDVEFGVASGERVGIAGPNGAGKSTLVRTLLGLVRPLAGSVERSTKRLGFVPQAPDRDPMIPLSLQEWVQLVGLSVDPEPWLELVGLAGRGSTPFAKLSGGEARRAFLAQVLARSPELVALDEPTAGVDVAETRRLLELLEGERFRSTALLVVAHEPDVLRRMTRALWVGDGRVEEIEPAEGARRLEGVN